MTDHNRDIGRAIGRILSDLRETQRRNNPQAEVAVVGSATDQLGLSETVTTSTPSSGGYDNQNYDVSTYD